MPSHLKRKRIDIHIDRCNRSTDRYNIIPTIGARSKKFQVGEVSAILTDAIVEDKFRSLAL